MAMQGNGVLDEEAGKGLTKNLIPHDHSEKHFTSGELVRDIILGVSDGLTVPFALAAGLSGANAPSSIVLTAGLAEVAAGAISMGLGGFLAAKSEADHYHRELKREQEEIVNVPETEAAEVAEILSQYGLEPDEYEPVVNALRRKPQAWLDFMMKCVLYTWLIAYRGMTLACNVNGVLAAETVAFLLRENVSFNWFELGLEKPDPGRALQSAVTIALSYILGGLVPLTPYIFIPIASKAVVTSVVVTLIALLFFGYVKGRFTGNKPIKSSLETMLIGAIASAAAFGMARAVQR